MSTIAEGVPPAEPMSPAQTVKLCQRMRLTQQMDAGVLSSDADYLCRIATELALGDPKRGIEPWDVGSFGECSVAFIDRCKSIENFADSALYSAEMATKLGITVKASTSPKKQRRPQGRARRLSVMAAKREWYQVAPNKRPVCRVGVELDSPKCEGSKQHLEEGELVEVQDTKAAQDGTIRICIGKNRWTGLVSKSGDDLLKKVATEDVPLLRAKVAVAKKGGLRKLEESVWNNYLENLPKDEQAKAKSEKKRGIKDMEQEAKKKSKPKLMERAPYHDRLKAAVDYAKKGGFDQDEMHIIRTMEVNRPDKVEGGVWCKIQYVDATAARTSRVGPTIVEKPHDF